MTIGAARTPLALLIELLWSFAAAAVFVAIFRQNDGPAPSFVAVTIVVLGSFALARALQLTDLDEQTMRKVGLVVSAVAVFVLLRAEYAPGEWIWDLGWLAALLTDTQAAIRPNAHVIAGSLALGALWLRGIIRGQSAVEFDAALGSASLGLLIVIVAALATPETREPVSWGAFAFAYAALALVALAVFRAPEPGVSIAHFARRWTVALAAIGGASIALTLIAAAIDPDAFGFLAPIGEPFAFVGSVIAVYVLGPIVWFIALPFQFVGWLLGQFIPDRPPQPPPEIAELPPEKPPEQRDQPVWFRILLWISGVGGVLLALAIAAMLLWFAFRRFARARARDPRERREEIEPESSLRDDLGDLLGAFARRFRRQPRPQNAVEVRRLYFEMLDAAADAGIERPAAATPHRFAPALDAHFASDVPSAITRAFTASRYGELPIEETDVRDLRARWTAVVRAT